MSIVRIVSAMDPNNSWCRNHTLLMCRAICEDKDVVILTNGEWPLTDEEIAFFPSGRHPVAVNIYKYFLTEWTPGDFILYQLGNNDNFVWIIDCFLNYPGAVLMHDISLFWLLSKANGLNLTFIEEEIGVASGLMLKKAFDWGRPRLSMLAVHSAYFNRAVLQYATGVVCHSPFQAETFKQKFPDKPVHSVSLVPNFLHELTPLEQRGNLRELRAVRGIAQNAVVFGIFGFQAFHKRLEIVLDAFCGLDLAASIKILLIGKWDKGVRQRCARALAELSRRGWLDLIDSYVPEGDLDGFIALSDIVINFRYPTAGESSGIACQALSVGVPLMVNKIGSFVDLPEQSVLRIPYSAEGEDARALTEELNGVLSRPDLLGEKQTAARRNVQFYKMARYKADYCRIIDEQMAGYEARLSRVTIALSIRRQNDRWTDSVPRSSGHVAIVLDDTGGGIKYVNPIVDIETTLNNLQERVGEVDRGQHSDVGGTDWIQPENKTHLFGQADSRFDILDESIDLSVFSCICLAIRPSGRSLRVEQFLQRAKLLPIGARVILSRSVMDDIALLDHFESTVFGESSSDYLKLLLLRDKYATELGLFRFGLTLVDEFTVKQKRYVVARRCSDIVAGKTPSETVPAP